jgi:hypothetical protein
MPFKRSFALSLLILALFGIGIVWNAATLTPSDQEMLRKAVGASSEEIKNYSLQQNRRGAAKTLLLSEGDERKIGMIQSEASELVYTQKEHHKELVEDMHGVQMLYQEEFLTQAGGVPIQVVVALQAEHATYFYKQQKWIAEKATIRRYQLPGHTFPENKIAEPPFFQGTADRIALDMSEPLPFLHTYGLDATFVREAA